MAIQDLVFPLGSAGGQATSTSPVTVDGGLYNLDYSSSNWGTGVWQIRYLLPDGSTFQAVGNQFSANGTQGPFAIASATRLQAQLVSGSPSANVIVRLARYQGGQS